jgi:hypothetical protein
VRRRAELVERLAGAMLAAARLDHPGHVIGRLAAAGRLISYKSDKLTTR